MQYYMRIEMRKILKKSLFYILCQSAFCLVLLISRLPPALFFKEKNWKFIF